MFTWEIDQVIKWLTQKHQEIIHKTVSLEIRNHQIALINKFLEELNEYP